MAEPNLDPGVGTFSVRVAGCDEQAYAAVGHRRFVDELRAGDAPADREFARTLARWSPRGLHRTAVSLIADRPETFREQLAAFGGLRHYLSGELTGEDLTPLREAGCQVSVVAGAGHGMMEDNLDGFVAALL